MLLDLPQDSEINGYAINLAGDNTTLKVEGEENITVYRAKIQNPEDPQPHQSQSKRRFYRHCGSCLWVYDRLYLVYIYRTS
nr:hypothetical protein [Chroococcidiopsis cubana]